MSPLIAGATQLGADLPRTCGDEPPDLETGEAPAKSAPHLRG